MKIAILGGAGVRTPLLVGGLCRSDLPLRTIHLFDPDERRLALIRDLSQRLAGDVEVEATSTSREAITGSTFVLASIRVGGIEARVADERSALRHGSVGQETVGAAGFAMALRNVPPMIRYAREIEELAPGAFLVNFTNPVGIVTQAVSTHSRARIIGICDTPTELFHETAHVLGLAPERCHFDYVGLNHLGWLREVFFDGEPQLSRIFSSPDRIEHLYRSDLFDPLALAKLRLLPTEYLYYYERADEARANLARAGQTRGQTILALNQHLFEALEGHSTQGTDPVPTYERYLAERDASYMQLESGATSPRGPRVSAPLTGYDRIALAVVRAIHHSTGDVLPVDVPSRGALPGVGNDDVVEIPCRLDRSGFVPLATREIPAAVAPLFTAVRHYETLTLQAAVEPSRERRLSALAANPLVGSSELAERLLDELVL